MDIISYLSIKLNINQSQVKSTIKMIEDGATIPFIARYKKEETGNLSDITLRLLEEEREKYIKLDERKQTVLKSIKEQNKLTIELEKQIEECDNLNLLETIYRPYKPKRKTRGSMAIEKGLKELSVYILKQNGDIESLNKFAASFISKEKGVNNIEEAINGAKDIIAEDISDTPAFYLFGKNYINKTGKIKSKQTKEDITNKYENYNNFETPIYKIKSYQVLALLRAKKEKKLTFSFIYDSLTIQNEIARKTIRRKGDFFENILKEAIQDSYKRLMGPSIENEILSDLFAKAQDASLSLFSKNLRQLLLASPLKDKQILGFDPGYKNGCKLALINKEGTVLTSSIIFPTIGKEKEAEAKLLSIYNQYGFDCIALGNGTASRESEKFLNSFLEKNKIKEVNITIVNESGASVYSASPIAIKEFPNMDIEERSSVCLARRLLDPMAELVKIPPEAIGVGQYQHDLDENKLKQTLEGTTIDAVNEVGVYLNTASASLLKYVSGLNEKIANSIVAYKEENGPFIERKDLLKVKGFGEKTFISAAGFLRINNDNPLEKTAVHPKDYKATLELLKRIGLSLKELGSEKSNSILNSNLDLEALSKELNLGIYTLADIIEELKKPGRDLREKIDSAILDKKVTDIKDLRLGMELNGTIRNLSDFGAFVDIGIHQDGLLHISEISNSFVKHPSEKLYLGEIVKVKVIKIDLERKRISLSMKQVNN